MTDTEVIKQAITQTKVEAVNDVVLAINGESRRQIVHPEEVGTLEATRHSKGISIRQPVFNWNAKDKYPELKNF